MTAYGNDGFPTGSGHRITHDSITSTDCVSHRWTDGFFAYVWHEDADLRRGSLLSVGPIAECEAGPKGWTWKGIPDRVYVPTYSNGPLIYGVTSFDPQTAWHSADEIVSVVRQLGEIGLTDEACLFQLGTARFLGSADGQYVLSNGEHSIPSDGDREAVIDPNLCDQPDFAPVVGERWAAVESITGEALAAEIGKVLDNG